MTALSLDTDDIIAQSDVPLEEDSGDTEEKQIAELLI